MSDLLTRLRGRLSETATVTIEDFPGVGSERGFSAYVCSYCAEGVHVGDVLAGGPKGIKHQQRCPLHKSRIVTLQATDLAAILDLVPTQTASTPSSSRYTFDALNSLPLRW